MGMKYILPLCSAFALYAIFFFSYQNGLHELGLKSVESGVLPGLNEPLRTVYTGVPKIDELLTVLTTFFWPAMDGSNPGLMLHTIGFSGTFGAAWILVTLESWRRGNSWTIAALYVFYRLITTSPLTQIQPHGIRFGVPSYDFRIRGASVRWYPACKLNYRQ